jgi:hypothetical protein
MSQQLQLPEFTNKQMLADPLTQLRKVSRLNGDQADPFKKMILKSFSVVNRAKVNSWLSQKSEPRKPPPPKAACLLLLAEGPWSMLPLLHSQQHAFYCCFGLPIVLTIANQHSTEQPFFNRQPAATTAPIYLQTSIPSQPDFSLRIRIPPPALLMAAPNRSADEVKSIVKKVSSISAASCPYVVCFSHRLSWPSLISLRPCFQAMGNMRVKLKDTKPAQVDISTFQQHCNNHSLFF